MVPTLIYNHLLRGKGTYQEIQVIKTTISDYMLILCFNFM
jgi:hypothetical protein